MIQIEELKLMQIFVAGRPYAQTRARHVDGKVYSNATGALKRWKGLLAHELRVAQRKMAFPGQEGALFVDMVFRMPIKEAKRWGELCHTKPDIDNLQKAVMDVMGDVGYFAIGDSQVAAGQVVKVWCRPGEEGVLISLGKVRTKKSPRSGDCEGGGAEACDWLAGEA